MDKVSISGITFLLHWRCNICLQLRQSLGGKTRCDCFVWYLGLLSFLLLLVVSSVIFLLLLLNVYVILDVVFIMDMNYVNFESLSLLLIARLAVILCCWRNDPVYLKELLLIAHNILLLGLLGSTTTHYWEFVLGCCNWSDIWNNWGVQNLSLFRVQVLLLHF